MICGYLYQLQGSLFIMPEIVKSDQTFLRFPERIEVIDHYYLGVTVTLHWFNQEAAEDRSHGGDPVDSLTHSDICWVYIFKVAVTVDTLSVP